MLRDGYTPLPPGKIASVVLYLEMRRPPPPRPGPRRTDLALARLGGGDAARYRGLYRAVGERWLWFGRLALSEPALAAMLDDPEVEAYELRLGDDPVGLLELDFRAAPDCELAYLGLVESALGKGAGRWTMATALAKAWSRPIARFWLHTCSLDHPDAVGFYLRSGFRPYAQAIEVVDDPRLTGLLPPEAGARWPPVA